MCLLFIILNLIIILSIYSALAFYRSGCVVCHFLRATAVPAGTAEARISYGDSVRLSVRLSRPGAETTE